MFFKLMHQFLCETCMSWAQPRALKIYVCEITPFLPGSVDCVMGGPPTAATRIGLSRSLLTGLVTVTRFCFNLALNYMLICILLSILLL